MSVGLPPLRLDFVFFVVYCTEEFLAFQMTISIKNKHLKNLTLSYFARGRNYNKDRGKKKQKSFQVCLRLIKN
jgi:hypothetical protein